MYVHSLPELKIELTQRCPLACVHCSTDSGRNQVATLPESLVMRLLHEATDLGLRNVVFTGGEPLLVDYLERVVATATELGVSSTLYTSGVAGDDLQGLSSAKAESLTRAGLQRFIFTLYSSAAQNHDSVTRYASHSVTLRSLSTVLSTNARVEIHFVALRSTYLELPGVIALAKSAGVHRVSVLRFVPQGRGEHISWSEDLTSEELIQLADMISRLRIEYPEVVIRTGSPFNILGIGYSRCNAAEDLLIINPKGEVSPCDAFKNIKLHDPEFGSIRTASLRDVWQRSSFLSRVRQIRKMRVPEVDDAAPACQTECLAQCVIRHGWRCVDPNIADFTAFGNERSAKNMLVKIATCGA